MQDKDKHKKGRYKSEKETYFSVIQSFSCSWLDSIGLRQQIDWGSRAVSKDDQQDVNNMPTDVKNNGKIDPNGVLKYGLVSGTAFKGTLNPVFYEDNYDYEVMQWFQEQLLRTNGDYEIDNDGAATYTMSSDKKTITIKIRDNVNWTDGKPVLAEDLQYAYEVLGSPQYTGLAMIH